MGPHFRTPVPGPTEKRRCPVSSEIKNSVAPVQDSYATNKTFAELGVLPELVGVLSEQGITTAFPIQALTISDALAGRDRERAGKHRPRHHAGVKLTVLAAGVDTAGQIGHELRIELASRE